MTGNINLRKIFFYTLTSLKHIFKNSLLDLFNDVNQKCTTALIIKEFQQYRNFKFEQYNSNFESPEANCSGARKTKYEFTADSIFMRLKY